MKNKKNTTPYVCNSVRTVGVIKPEFDPQSRNFLPPKLSVRGTGFWLKDQRAFVTCAHVLDGLIGGDINITGLLVVGGNGIDYKNATISIIDWSHDLAILSVVAEKDFLEKQIKNGLEVYDEKIDVGQKVSYAGFPFGNALLNAKHTPTYAEGLVGSEILEDTTPKTIQISGSVAGGYSGAPIVLLDNPQKVIAVLANSVSQQAGSANIFKGIHWKHIKELFELVKS